MSARVLDGDPAEIEAALDALADRAVVTSEAFGEPGVFIRTDAHTWHGSGSLRPYKSRHLARYCAPLVVIR